METKEQGQGGSTEQGEQGGRGQQDLEHGEGQLETTESEFQSGIAELVKQRDAVVHLLKSLENGDEITEEQHVVAERLFMSLKDILTDEQREAVQRMLPNWGVGAMAGANSGGGTASRPDSLERPIPPIDLSHHE